ncbi:MAG: ATP-dependent helicase [Microbacterium sp.]|nr:ATP-dependent helicase [Microbacterium sp.]
MGNGGVGEGTEVTALDHDQRAVAALPLDFSGVVVGAPGSGKTSALVARVHALTASGPTPVDPDRVLVLTPSRQTATALRDRLALAIGAATSGAPARSVASFAFQIVRAAEVHRGAPPPQLLTGGDEDQLVQDLLAGDAEDETAGERRWPAWLGAEIRATRGFRSEVRAFIAECTTLGIEPDRLRRMGEAAAIPAWTALASFFAEYLHVRADMRGAYRDAAGLIREAVGVLRTGDAVGREAVSGLAAILVDDAQELTLGAVELLEACRELGIPVVAFGDPDIGAGAFRGATPENFARLSRALGSVRALTGSHRGSAAQVDLVRSLTERIGATGVVVHRRRPDGVAPDATVRTVVARSTAEEVDVVARILRERHVLEGVPWSRCAVIAHDTRQVAMLEAELAAREVPARASGPGRPLGALRPARDLLRTVELGARDVGGRTFDDLSDALQALTGGLDPVELRRLRTALRHEELKAGGERSARELLVSAMAHPVEFDLVDTREARRAARLARTLAGVGEAIARGDTAHELLWTVWEASGLERAWVNAARGTGPLAEQAGRDLDVVVALFQAAKRFVERQPGDDPMRFVRGILDSDVAEDRLNAPAPAESVAVLTPAGALGVEYDTVVVAGVQDGVWPNTRLRGSLFETWRLADLAIRPDDAASTGTIDRRRSALHDELRLFVRALSRATRRVIVTAVDDDDAGPSVLFEMLPPPEPIARAAELPLSLRGLVAGHRRTLTEHSGPRRATPADRRRAAQQLAVLADAGVPGADPSGWYGVAPVSTTAPLRDLSREDVRVSPSRLHTLEECELNWVIGDLGGDPGGATAGLGTIIHAALEHSHGRDEEQLWAEVEARWGELDFEAPWRDRAEKTRARELVRRLHLYLRRFEDAGGRLIDAEPHFEVAIPLDDVEAFEHGAILSGYIDRVELTPDGAVVIVDLKTGKREPQTDTAVAENPQLAAYQLAFEAGAIPGAVGLPGGGAKLLVLRPTAATKDYVTPHQPPLDEADRQAFLERVRSAVGVMRGVRFAAPFEEHCRDEHSYGLCRIHTIGAVSAS